MKVDNLYHSPEDHLVCLMVDNAPMFNHHSDVWEDGVIFATRDGLMRSMLLERWTSEFAKVADYQGDDEAVLRMIRRTNPGAVDLDFVRIFESWHESEINITGHMLELAVAATMIKLAAEMNWRLDDRVDLDKGFGLTITTDDLQRVVQNYEIERVPEPHGFTFVMRKSFPDEG